MTLVLLLLFLPNLLVCSEVGEVLLPFCCDEGEELGLRSVYNGHDSFWNDDFYECAAPRPPSPHRRHHLKDSPPTSPVPPSVSPIEGEAVYILEAAGSQRHTPTTIRSQGKAELNCINGVSSAPLQLYRQEQTPSDSAKPVYDLRLEGSTKENEGNVILEGNPICGSIWGQREAAVVCRMLGYYSGMPTANSKFGPVSGNFIDPDNNWMSMWHLDWDGGGCRGREESLYNCSLITDECRADNAAGVICSTMEDMPIHLKETYHTSLVQSGALINPFGEHLAPDRFCISRNPGRQDQLLAVSCNPDKTASFVSLVLWRFLRIGQETTWGFGRVTFPKLPETLLVRMADQDNSGTLDLQEFNNFFMESIKYVFDIIDEDENGYIRHTPHLEGSMFYFISSRTFNMTMMKIFNLLDYTKNGVISFSEDFPLERAPDGFPVEDKNHDGKVTFKEMNVEPVTWPSALFKIYTELDQDKNEELSLEEFQHFSSKIFGILDANKDMKIFMEEIPKIAKKLGLPGDKVLALQVIVRYYASTFNHIFTDILRKVEVDTNQMTSFDEILNFSDSEWFHQMLVVISRMIYPSFIKAPLLYLVDVRFGDEMYSEDGLPLPDVCPCYESLMVPLENLFKL